MKRRRMAGTVAAATLAAPVRGMAQIAREKIRLVSAPTEGSTNVFYAIKTGVFARNGLDVEFTAANSGAAATTAVISGSYEIGKTTLSAVLSSHLRGIPLVIVAPGLLFSSRSPWALLQVPTDAALRTGADLNGKTIGVTAIGDINSVSIKAWVDKNGGDWHSLKFVEIPNAATEAALQQHRIDAALLQSPQLEASLSAGTSKTIGDCLGAIAPLFLTAVWVARRDWSEEHSGALARFRRAYADATAYVDTHPAETVNTVVELTGVERSNVLKMRRSQNAKMLDPALIQPFIDAAAKYGAIERAFPARELLAGS
jgi:ABC-type nitrate/sulfonate/bicarbonate transport system substrate-binding protein